MECFICGTIVDREQICPHCGAKVGVYRKILNASNAYYSDAVYKAQVRDLSGAIRDLKSALKYNKYNTRARNLLGLCYYETGDLVEALAEWIISVNFQPNDNRATVYLSEFQNNDGLLESMNNTIKKYNQAIAYCKQGDRDLARIQLRRVISVNPKMVRAHQLYAMISIMDKKYDEARKSLNAANKIDARNTTTLRYMKEVRAGLKEENANKKRRIKSDVTTFNDRNDMVIIPEHGFFDWFDSSRSSLLNMLIGIGIGLLICFVLVVPTIKQNAKTDAANALIDANEEVAGASSSVSSLKKQVNDLKAQLEKYSQHGDAVTTYESLYSAKEKYDAGDIDGATADFENVNADYLGERGRTIYDQLVLAINTNIVSKNYDEGVSLYNQQKYDDAIKAFRAVTEIDEGYQDGEVLYYLASSYSNNSDIDNAIKYYSKLVTDFPNSPRVDEAKSYLALAGASVQDKSKSNEDDASTTQETD